LGAIPRWQSALVPCLEHGGFGSMHIGQKTANRHHVIFSNTGRAAWQIASLQTHNI